MRRAVAIGLLLFQLPDYHGKALATSGLTLKGLGVYTQSPVEFVLTDPPRPPDWIRSHHQHLVSRNPSLGLLPHQDL